MIKHKKYDQKSAGEGQRARKRRRREQDKSSAREGGEIILKNNKKKEEMTEIFPIRQSMRCDTEGQLAARCPARPLAGSSGPGSSASGAGDTPTTPPLPPRGDGASPPPQRHRDGPLQSSQESRAVSGAGGGLAQGERLRPKRQGTKTFCDRSVLSTLIYYNLMTLINCNQALVFLILIESK